MYRTFYPLTLLLFISSISFAQPQITLSKTVGTGGTESIHDMIADHDGHLIALGQCDSIDRDTSCHYHGGSSDIWLVKMDAEGNIIWQKCYGGSEDDYAYQIIETADRGFLFTGITWSDDGDISFNHGSTDIWLVKVDSNGNMLWQQSIGGASGEKVQHTMQLKNGKFLMACVSGSSDGTFPLHYGSQLTADSWIVIIHPNGLLDTVYRFGGSDDDYINDVIEMPNGDWQMFGYTESNDYDLAGTTAYGNWDGWILRTDSNGAILWQQRYGDGSPNQIVGAVALPDKGFLAGGNTNFVSVWVTKFDSVGNKLIDNEFGGSGDQVMRDRLRIHQINSDLFAIGALSSGGGGDVGANYGFNDFWCLTVDSNAALVNSIVAGGSNPDEPFTNNLVNANEVLQSGLTGSNDFDIADYHGNGDGWFIKVSNFTASEEPESLSTAPVSVHPNPVADVGSVYMNRATLQQSRLLEVFDLHAQLVQTYCIGKSSNQFSVEGLPAGMYLFCLKGKGGEILGSGRFMVQ